MTSVTQDGTSFDPAYSSTYIDQMTAFGADATSSTPTHNANRSYSYLATKIIDNVAWEPYVGLCGYQIDRPNYPDTYPDGGADDNSGQLMSVTRYTGVGSTTLTTTYSDYDGFGHPQHVTDPNSVETDYTYDSSGHVTSETKGGLTTNYAYQNDKLVAITYPQGNSEVFCYQQGAGPDCTGGTPTDLLQWKAKTAGYGGTGGFPTVQPERVDYQYWPDGTLAVEAYKDSSGVRRVKKYSSDAQKRPTWEGWGGSTTVATGASYQMTRGFDGADNLSAVGLPYNNPPAFCDGVDVTTGKPSSTACSWLYNDRANRLASVDSDPSGGGSFTQRTCIHYDAQNNISNVFFGCDASGSGNLCSECSSVYESLYQYDDFGNLVEATLPWESDDGTSSHGTTLFQYDGMGDVVDKVVPGFKTGTKHFQYDYDALGRQLDAYWYNSSSDNELHAFGYDTLPITWDSSCGATPANLMGHKAYQDDAFGRTYYSYDDWGRVTREIRMRAVDGVVPTTCTSNYNNPITSYTYSDNGDLASVTYPYGRQVNYNYNSDGETDRVKSVNVSIYAGYPDGGITLNVATKILDDVAWEPYGGLRGYQIDHPVSDNHSAVEYMLGDDAGAAPDGCPSTAPQMSDSDLSGRLRGIWVTQGNFTPGSPNSTDTYRRTYTWQADQVKQIDTCVYSGPDQQQNFTYDRLLRLTQATANGADAGGAYSERDLGYDTRGNVTSVTQDGTSFDPAYSSTYLDHMTAFGPDATSSTPTHNANRSYTYRLYSGGMDGSVECVDSPSAMSTNSSHGGSVCVDPVLMGSSYPPDNLAYSEAESCDTGGTCSDYVYYYDAENRRINKSYPLGPFDEYYYDLNNELLVDRGNSDVDTPAYWVDDDYIWLGGRPVAIVHGKLDTSGNRLADYSSDCDRNGQAEACDVYFPITDHIGKPVLMLNGSRQIVGTGEYDPNGNVNRVSMDAESEHTVTLSSGEAIQFGEFEQPDLGILEQVRARVMAFDASCETGSPAGVRVHNGSWTWNMRFCHMSNHWSPWHVQNGETTLSTFALAGDSPTIWGAVVDAYEYRRYQSGAVPFWTPLRFPGQYHDDETDLNQNWNRFYDGATDRYTSSEPILIDDPESVADFAEQGQQIPAYAYVDDNSINFVDTDGNQEALVPPIPLDPVTLAGTGLLIWYCTTHPDACTIRPPHWTPPQPAKPPDPCQSNGDRPDSHDKPEHSKGTRPSTQEKHEKGQRRKGTDKRGGEKGDARRPYSKWDK